VPGCLELAAEESKRLLSDPNTVIDRFLCRALRGEPAPWAALSGTDSDAFLARCGHHGIAALLFHRVQQDDDWQSWPLEVRQALDQASKEGVAKDLLRTHYLQQLLVRLAEQDIPCLLTKGEALAVSHYQEPGTRTRSDSDLFIRIGDISRVRQTVLGMGYRVASTVYKSHQFTVVRADDETYTVRFDIHWRILNAPRFARVLSFEQAFQNSIEFPGMAPARMLCNADALMLACMHRFGSERHDRDRLIWICDIHELVKVMTPAELTQFATLAVARNVQAVCLDGLLKAQECFLTRIPKPAFALLRTPESPLSMPRRFSESQLGLLGDDWKKLKEPMARFELLRELFIPTSQFLLHKYSKNSKWWLPLLYVRQIVGGVFARLTFK
jgi:hypothetical protein